MLLHANSITKKIGNKYLVDHIDFSLDHGQVMGLLGTNGAGKSSTLRMICGLLRPDSGSVTVCDEDLYQKSQHVKRHIGYASESPNFPLEQTVRDVLDFCARIRRVTQPEKAVEVALERLSLTSIASQKIVTLSKGYQQRVSIAQAIVHKPELVILDEPSSGLDPSQSEQLRRLIKELAIDHGIILSSHLLTEVEALCTDAIIMAGGKILQHCKLQEQDHCRVFNLRFNTTNWQPEFKTIASEIEAELLANNIWQVSFPASHDWIPDIVRYLVENQCGIQEVSPQTTRVESAYTAAIQGQS